MSVLAVVSMPGEARPERDVVLGALGPRPACPCTLLCVCVRGLREVGALTHPPHPRCLQPPPRADTREAERAWALGDVVCVLPRRLSRCPSAS